MEDEELAEEEISDDMLMEEDVWKTIELPTGRTARIYDGTVAEHNKALRYARNKGPQGEMDQTAYLMVLFSELVEIDGESLAVDQVEDLSLREYYPVQSALDELANPPT